MLYSLREGRTLPFKTSDSPGLPTEILRPGLQVHFLTASDDSGGQRAVQISLEPVASLDARLRYVAKRAARRSTRAADSGRTKAEAAAEAAGAAQEDIAFMGAGLSEVSTSGRRGTGAGRRDREKADEHPERAVAEAVAAPDASSSEEEVGGGEQADMPEAVTEGSTTGPEERSSSKEEESASS